MTWDWYLSYVRRFYEAWKDIETNSVVGTTEITNFRRIGDGSDDPLSKGNGITQ